ncbi:hypothetical protein AMK59_6805, partial [Oryctes borbonicus]
MSFEMNTGHHLSQSLDNYLHQLSFLPTMSLHSISDYLDDIKISRRKGKDYDSVDYTQLPPTDNGFIDAQFIHPPQKIPWQSICLATFLLIIGSILLVMGTMIVTGHIDMKYSDRMWPMIILGVLMFIPGAYHVRIAYYAYKEVPGYSFDDIPE